MLGIAFEKQKVGFKEARTVLMTAVNVLIAMAGVVLISLLGKIDAGAAYHLFRVARYFLLGFFVIGAYPFIAVKLKLLKV